MRVSRSISRLRRPIWLSRGRVVRRSHGHLCGVTSISVIGLLLVTSRCIWRGAREAPGRAASRSWHSDASVGHQVSSPVLWFVHSP